MNRTASPCSLQGVPAPELVAAPSSVSPSPSTSVDRADGLPSAPAADTPEALRHLARQHEIEPFRRRRCGAGEADRAGIIDENVDAAEARNTRRDGLRDLLLAANVADHGQRLPARRHNLLRRAINRAGQFGMRLVGLGGDDDIRPIACPMPDTGLLDAIRAVLADSPFHGEGHRKVWAELAQGSGRRRRLEWPAEGRLRVRGVRTSRRRVLRLMRRNDLLAPSRVGAPRGPRSHDGTIIPATIDTMWGTDLTTTITGEGQAAVFIAIDHFSAECVGIHAARQATRFEALEPIRQGVRQHFGGFAKDIARGLSVRHDHGSQYMSDAFQSELHFLGIESSPAFVRAPEGNGCAERFIRTLKENLLWVRTFDTVDELRLALLEFRETYNTTWLVERHGFITPQAVRQNQLQPAALAA